MIESGTAGSYADRPDVAFDSAAERLAIDPEGLVLHRPTVDEDLLATGGRHDVLTVSQGSGLGIQPNDPMAGFLDLDTALSSNTQHVGSHIATGDFDGDGLTDIVVMGGDAEQPLQLSFGTGVDADIDDVHVELPFLPQEPMIVYGSEESYDNGDEGAIGDGQLLSLAIGDLDLDGLDDIVVGLEGDADLIVFLSIISGPSINFARFLVELPNNHDRVTSLAVHDLNEAVEPIDFVEIVAVSEIAPSGAETMIHVLTMDGPDILAAAEVAPPIPIVTDLAVADLDGNGLADMVVSGTDVVGGITVGAIGVLFHDDLDITTARSASLPIGLETQAQVVEVAELDADLTVGLETEGFLEIVVAGQGDFHGRTGNPALPTESATVGIMTVVKLTPPDLSDDEGLEIDGAWPFGDAECIAPAAEASVTDIAIGHLDTDGLPDVVIADEGQSKVHVLRRQPIACATFVTFATHGQTYDAAELGYLQPAMREVRDRVQGAPDRCDPETQATVNMVRRPGDNSSDLNPEPDLCPVQVITVEGHWESDASANAAQILTGRIAAGASMVVPTPVNIYNVLWLSPSADLHPTPYWLKLPLLFVFDVASMLRYTILLPVAAAGDGASRDIASARSAIASDMFKNAVDEAAARARASMEPSCGQVIVDLVGYSRGGAQVGELLRTIDAAPLEVNARVGATLLDAIDREQLNYVMPWQRAGYVVNDPIISDGAVNNASRDERWTNIHCARAIAVEGFWGSVLSFGRTLLTVPSGHYDWLEAMGLPRGLDRALSLPLDVDANPAVGAGETCVQAEHWNGTPADPTCTHQPMPCAHTNLNAEMYFNPELMDGIIPPAGSPERDQLATALSSDQLLLDVLNTLVPAEEEFFSFEGSTLVGELMADPRHEDFDTPHFDGWGNGNEAVGEACIPDPGASLEVRPLGMSTDRQVAARDGRDDHIDDDGGAERVRDPHFLGLRALVVRSASLRRIVDGMCGHYSGTKYATATADEIDMVNTLLADGDPSWVSAFCDHTFDADAQAMYGTLDEAADGWPDGVWETVAGLPTVGTTSGDIQDELLDMLERVAGPLPFDPGTVTQAEADAFAADIDAQVTAWEQDPSSVDESEIAALALEASQLSSGMTSALEAFVELPLGLTSTVRQKLAPGSLRDDTLKVRVTYAFTDAAGSLTVSLNGPEVTASVQESATAGIIGQRRMLALSAARGTNWVEFEQDVVEVSGSGVKVYGVFVHRDAPIYSALTDKYYELVAHSGGLTWEHAATFASHRVHQGRTGRLLRIVSTATYTAAQESSFVFQTLDLSSPAWLGGTWDPADPSAKWEDGSVVALTVSAGGTDPHDEVHPLYLHSTASGDQLLHDRTRPVRGETAFGYVIEYAP